MVGEPQVLPDNALELVDKVPLNCCVTPDMNIDPGRPGMLTMTCRSCGQQIEGQIKDSPLRKENLLKRREQIRKDMAEAISAMIEKWNYLVITGEQM